MTKELYRTLRVPSIMRVGAAALTDAAGMIADYQPSAGRLLVASGPGPSKVGALRLLHDLQEQGLPSERIALTEGSCEEAAALAHKMIVDETDLLVAVGGGRVVDTAKYASFRVGRPFFCLPTSIAHDGISSPVASLIDAHGVRRSYAAHMPAGIIIDLDLVMEAPRTTLRAGLGDLLSNISACADWRLAEEQGLDEFDEYSGAIAESAALSAVDLDDLGDPEQVATLVKGLLLSGLAMATAGSSRPCSGGEHLFSHAMDQRSDLPKAPHGLQVALGSLLTTLAQGRLTDALLETYAVNGLPMRCQDLSLSREQFLEVLRMAPSTRPERWTVLSEITHSATRLPRLVDELEQRVAGVACPA